MSQIIKYYKKFLIHNFFYFPIWILRIIFPQIRTKIRGSKIDFQSYAYIRLNPESTLYKIQNKDLPKIRKVIERNKINSKLSLRPNKRVLTKDYYVFNKHENDQMLLREYIPNKVDSDKIILFFHGGGWTIDSVETYDDMVKYFSDYLNMKIYSFEYSLAPEKKFPNALKEAEDIYKWFIKNGTPSNQISLFGDSAGAHMVGSLVYKLAKHDSDMPNSLLMLYPPCDPLFQSESINLLKDKYFLLHADLAWFWDKFKQNKADENDPMFNLLKFDLNKAFPSTILVTGGFDPICDEGAQYANLLKNKNTNIRLLNYPTLFHNFAFMTKLNSAKKAVNNFLDEYKKIV